MYEKVVSLMIPDILVFSVKTKKKKKNILEHHIKKDASAGILQKFSALIIYNMTIKNCLPDILRY